MVNIQQDIEFALCIEDRGCDDLEKGKIYRIIPDHIAAKEGYLRLIDESAEDYLYPESHFVFLNLPQKAQNALFVRV